MASLRRKFAVVSHVLPPSSSGQAVVLYRLLSDLNLNQYTLLSVRDYSCSQTSLSPRDAVTSRLPGQYVHLPPAPGIRVSQSALVHSLRLAYQRIRQVAHRFASTHAFAGTLVSPNSAVLPSRIPPPSWPHRALQYLQSLEEQLHINRELKHRARLIARTLRRESCEAVISCSGDLLDIPAAYQASCMVGIPFFAYMFDDYALHLVPSYQRRFAQTMSQAILPHAAGVIVPNEFLARAYRERYGLEPVIIPNPVEVHDPPLPSRKNADDVIRIVYTGAVYSAHFDAFHRLIAAIRNWPDRQIQLHIYTPCNREFLERNGVTAPAYIHPLVTNAEALSIQQQADFVFLPLAFSSPIQEVVNTSAPGKMGELLCCGRPIIVHSPAESFVSWYFRHHQCGLVVDHPDVLLLREEISKLIANEHLQQTLVQRARQRAIADFSISQSRSRFSSLLQF